MCLIKRHKWPKVAWKPIKVYKVLTILQSYYYKDTPLYYTPSMLVPIRPGGLLKSNLPWWNQLSQAIKKLDLGPEVVHSYIDQASAERAADRELIGFVFEATIPRFSLYWLGNANDIGSTKIVIGDRIIPLTLIV